MSGYFGFKKAYIDSLGIAGYPEIWHWMTNYLFKKAGIGKAQAVQYYQSHKTDFDGVPTCAFCGSPLQPETLACGNQSCVLFGKPVYRRHIENLHPADAPDAVTTNHALKQLTYVDWANMIVAFAPETYPWESDFMLAYQMMCRDVSILIEFAKQIQAKQNSNTLRYWGVALAKCDRVLVSLPTEQLVTLAYWRNFQAPSLVERIYAGRNYLAAYLNPASHERVHRYLRPYFLEVTNYIENYGTDMVYKAYQFNKKIVLLFAEMLGVVEFQASSELANILKNEILEAEEKIHASLKGLGYETDSPSERYGWQFNQQYKDNPGLGEFMEKNRLLDFFAKIETTKEGNPYVETCKLVRSYGVDFSMPFETVLSKVWEAKDENNGISDYLFGHLYFLYQGGYYSTPKCSSQESLTSYLDDNFVSPEKIFILSKVYDWNAQTLLNYSETLETLSRFIEKLVGITVKKKDPNPYPPFLTNKQVSTLFELQQKAYSLLCKLPITDKNISTENWLEPKFVPVAHFALIWKEPLNQKQFAKALENFGIPAEIGEKIGQNNLYSFLKYTKGLIELYKTLHCDIAHELYQTPSQQVARRAVLSDKKYSTFMMFVLEEKANKKVNVKMLAYAMGKKSEEEIDKNFDVLLKELVGAGKILYCPSCGSPVSLTDAACGSCGCTEKYKTFPIEKVYEPPQSIYTAAGGLSIQAEFTNISGLMSTYLTNSAPAVEMDIVALPKLPIVKAGEFGKKIALLSSKLASIYLPGYLSLPQFSDIDGLVFEFAGVAHLGGVHEKHLLKDQNGVTWLAKPDKHLLGVRAYVEAFASQVFKLCGIYTPPTFVIQHNDYLTSVQPLLDNVKPLSPDPQEWTKEQCKTVVQSQIVRWVLSDHDGNVTNYLVLSGKDCVFPVDMGQAYRYFGKDELSLTYHPNSAFATPEPLSNIFWREVKHGELSFEWDWILETVSKIEEIDNQFYAEQVANFANIAVQSDKIEWVGSFRQKIAEEKNINLKKVKREEIAARFVDMALERKNSVRADYEKFIQSIVGNSFSLS